MPDKPVFIVRHARNRMRRDGVAPSMIDEAIDSPDDIEDTIEGRHNYWKRVEFGWLRVTIADEAEQLVVVSVVVKERRPGRRR